MRTFVFLVCAGLGSLAFSAAPERDDPQRFIDTLLRTAEQAYRKGNFAKAFELTLTAAEAGNAQAQYNLGVLFSQGKGIPRNYEKATEWYLKAADQGHRGAMINAGVILEEGLGGTRDLQFAATLRRLAAESEKAKSPESAPSRKGEVMGDAAKAASPPQAWGPAGSEVMGDTAKAASPPRAQPGKGVDFTPSSPPSTRAGLWIGLGCFAALIGAALWYRRMLSPSRESLGDIRDIVLAPTTPAAQAYKVFWRYKKLGGDIESIPNGRLQEIFLAAGRLADYVDFRGFTVPQALGLAKVFSEAGRHAEALKFILNETVLHGLSHQEDTIREVIRLAERSGGFGELPANMVKAPADVSVLFAKVLIWVGHSAVCEKMLEARKVLTPEEERLLATATAPDDAGRPLDSSRVSRPPSPLVDVPTALPFSLLGGKYEVRRVLGEGGMGVVYEGFESKLQRKVAVKRMHREIRSDPKVREHFINEARMIAKVKHPYIVGIHDIVEDGGELYLILDHVDGRTLSDIIIERGRLPLTECKEILRYVCEAVDFAHRMKVLHGDLKPANIMINQDGFAMVMDFGLARDAKLTRSRVTAGSSSGSPAYMSPEQHLGRASRSSDIYSLGAMLYEMLTGNLPFLGPDFLAQKERRVYASPSGLNPDIPASCDKLLAAALDPDPKTRMESAMDFFEKLRAA